LGGIEAIFVAVALGEAAQKMGLGTGTGIMRMFTAIPTHATVAIIMGYYIGKAKFDKKNRIKYHLFGIGGAVLFHGLYDFSLMQNEIKGLKLIGALASLYIAIRLSKKAIKMHNEVSPFNEENQSEKAV